VLLAHKKSGGQAAQALGRSRGGFTTKIHLVVDALGNPLRVLLTGGQVHDSTQAFDLLEGLMSAHVIADRGYASQAIVTAIEQRPSVAVIPPHQSSKTPREYDRWLYRERHLIECCVNKLKHFRRVFSRFDKLQRRYAGFVQFASALLWLR